MKPLKRKAYGSIPHLPNSRLGSGIVLKPWQNISQVLDVVRTAKDRYAYAQSRKLMGK
jgi:hypothetical protein